MANFLTEYFSWMSSIQNINYIIMSKALVCTLSSQIPCLHSACSAC